MLTYSRIRKKHVFVKCGVFLNWSEKKGKILSNYYHLLSNFNTNTISTITTMSRTPLLPLLYHTSTHIFICYQQSCAQVNSMLLYRWRANSTPHTYQPGKHTKMQYNQARTTATGCHVARKEGALLCRNALCLNLCPDLGLLSDHSQTSYCPWNTPPHHRHTNSRGTLVPPT